MKIVYTSHLEYRLRAREIFYDLPKDIFRLAREHYYDSITEHYIAIGKVKFEGKMREMALTYDKNDDIVELITIHPIRLYQKISRIKSGRWKKHEQ
ncbi:MAG: hypothetical protein HYV35_03615 [Lentisphaerae bacterium]|nr:hypothetical protein [Lentisphaerota bacterium]